MTTLQSYRSKAERLVAGVMSGTSLDAVDVALVRVGGTGEALHHELVGFHAVPFDAGMRVRLLDASAGTMPARELFELESDLGACYAEAIANACDAYGVAAADLDAIGLHGQTVYHAPRRVPNGVTVQLAGAAIVCERLGVLVVHDFRTADVAAGGEGAPLVPYCDYVLLRSPHANRVALNIGGIANVTWLPRGVRPEQVIAFDTGPGNMLIDAAMRELYDRDMDLGGSIAAVGTVQEDWLATLLQDEYYAWPPPKSAGRERFGEEVGRRLAREGMGRGMRSQDVIATLACLTARTIAHSVRRFAAGDESVDEMIVGGGGLRNAAMMRMLAAELPDCTIRDVGEYGLPADAKEAICFAILANETLMETPANLPSVTGARRPVICGAIRLPSA
ncbi:MAG TPA: anhydro-N-acetylmuramic acid kinase [Candidatus Kapabacteria bacterium]|nr:anhydro-N-acetylmuramic acid kinase [Candidatus Kapabacteria bacterium]